MSYPNSSNQGSYPVDPKTGWPIQPTKSFEQKAAEETAKRAREYQEQQAAEAARKRAGY